MKGPVCRQQCVGDLERHDTSGRVHSLSRWSLRALVASCNSVPVPWGSPHSATPAPDLKVWDARGKKGAFGEWTTGHELPLRGQTSISYPAREVMVWFSEKKSMRFFSIKTLLESTYSIVTIELKKKKKPNKPKSPAKHSLQSKCGSWISFVNKVLLEHSNSHPSAHCSLLPSCHAADLCLRLKPHGPQTLNKAVSFK